jgi:hypothetical protein
MCDRRGARAPQGSAFSNAASLKIRDFLRKTQLLGWMIHAFGVSRGQKRFPGWSFVTLANCVN